MAISLLLTAVSGPVLADVFVLNTGGRVRGEWLNRTDQSAKTYVVRTDRGIVVSVAAERVAKTIREPSPLAEYERIAPGFADTIDGQWKLAEWCRERKLDDQRALHLQRIIELDPDHAVARRLLGFSRVKGRWTTREDFRQRNGYVRYNGRWYLPQDVELMEARRKREVAQREWNRKVGNLREQLRTARASHAARELLAIRDPMAVHALTQMLASEPLRSVKMMAVEVLGAVGSPDAKVTLINASLADPDEEIFHAAIDELVPLKTAEIVAVYIKALKDNNNVRVNRAAYALSRLGDKTVIAPLIEALVTTHKVVLPGNGNSPDAITTSFAKPGTAGVNPGFGGTNLQTGDSSKVLLQQAPNQQVLSALVKLSGGVSFGFNEKQWRFWYITEQKQAAAASTR